MPEQPFGDAVADDVWRAATPQVVAALVRRYGDFDRAEEATQEALLAASVQWPRHLQLSDTSQYRPQRTTSVPRQLRRRMALRAAGIARCHVGRGRDAGRQTRHELRTVQRRGEIAEKQRGKRREIAAIRRLDASRQAAESAKRKRFAYDGTMSRPPDTRRPA